MRGEPPGEFPTTFGAFLDGWYGPVAAQDVMAGSALPRPLAEWHQLETARGRPIAVQNHVVVDERPALRFGKRPVYIENQAVWLWGVDPEDPEGEVFERENETDAQWTPTGERLRAFLLHVAVFEAVLGAPAGLGMYSVTRPVLRSVTDLLGAVPVKPWRWPGPRHTLWYREDVVAFSCSNAGSDSGDNEDHSMLFVGARTEQALASFDALKLPIDYDTRESGPVW